MQGKKYYLFLVEDILTSQGHFVERKLGDLAKSEETFEGGAFNIKFVPNVDGTKKLTFSIPVYYCDPRTGEFVLNPRYKHISNERKVRLQYDGEYHEFVIKNVQEARDDSLAKIMQVTCMDANMEDLGKKGWSLYFDEYNGIGYIDELMPLVIGETDWVYDAANSDTFYEKEYLNKDGVPNTDPGASQDALKTTYDPQLGNIGHYLGSRNALALPAMGPDTIEVYKYTLQEFVQSEVGRNFLSNGTSFYTLDHWIPVGGSLSTITEENGTYPRFIRSSGGQPFYNNSLDTKNFTFTTNNAYTFSATIRNSSPVNLVVEIGDEFGMTLNQVARQTFSIPSSGGRWVTYGFQFNPRIAGKFNRVFLRATSSTPTDFGKVRIEQGGRNAILNSDFHNGTSNWSLANNPSGGAPQQSSVLNDYEFRSHVLKTNQVLTTTGQTEYFRSFNSSDLSTISFDMKGDVHGSLSVIFRGWKNGTLDQQQINFDYNNIWDNKSGAFRLVSIQGYDTISIQFIPSSLIYLTNIKFEMGAKTMWTPALEDEIVQYAYSPVADYIGRDYYYYYENGIKTMLNLTAAQITTLRPQYEKPLKIRTLLGEKSNCYNLIQTLCELFEGWAQYHIEYNPDGTIAVDQNGRRKKRITIKEEIGKDLPYGIEYGINLKGITRDINTDEIVTKMYVENNEFEYAKDGIVSIAQSLENPSGETYIINLDYFIEVGLLPEANTKADIAGYNIDMKRLNTSLDKDTTLRNELEIEMSQSIVPQLETLSFKEIALEESLRAIEDQLKQLLPTAEIDALKEQRTYYQQLLADARITTGELRIKRERYEQQIAQLTASINAQLEQKRAIIKAFNSKYANYIREGVWQDSNYIYPDLFYRDAVQTARISSQPTVSYNITMVDLSYLDEFGYLTMSVGDKTFVRDSEIFLKNIDNEFYPQDIDVFVSEIEYALDDPGQTTVRVQNYKSRFEDIFQRIVASTESLKLNQKIYDRSSNFTTDQQIDVDILQRSLTNNALILAQSRNGDVIIDGTGITVSDTDNPNRKVRIVSGGIFITKDGINWKAGITPDGLSIDQLTAGLIDTKNIQIWNSIEPRFLWDANGLIAYGLDRNGRTDFNSRIVYNHDGLVFSRNINSGKAELSLTWDGLMMNLQDGAVRIGSGAGIVVEDNQPVPIRRVEIGKIDRIAGESDTFNKDNPLSEPIYGMVLRNADGMETMITSDTGELWLKRAITVGDKGGQDMAGVSGITQYSQREIQNYIRNEQYYLLAKAREAGDQSEIDRLTALIAAPIDRNTFDVFRSELEADPIRFWSGSNAPTQASFRVYQSGLMYATNAYIEGNIIATNGFFKGRVYVGEQKQGEVNTGAGISGLKSDNVRFWAGSPFVGGSNLESEPEDGLFKVYNTGRVYATNMDVHGLMTAGETTNGVYSPTIFIAGTDYMFSGVLRYTPTPASLKARLWAGGLTPNSSNIVITADGSLYASDIHVSGKIEGAGLTVAQININDAGIYTTGFTPGVVGAGWMINNDGTANFHNVAVRGEISTAIFKHNEIQVAGGNILVRPSSALKNDTDFTGLEGTSVSFDVEDPALFKVGDFIQLREETSVTTIKISAIVGDTLTGEVRTTGNSFVKGAPIVNFGTTGDAGILLSASNNSMNMTDGAVIDMMETDTEDDNLKEYLHLRIGDISGIADAELPTEGYGLYADNVALRGNLFLNNAGIYTGSEKAGGERLAIRFWSGTNFENRHLANFKVYEDGTVLARGGIFEGKIIADEGGFSGSVGLGGITINDNTGSFYIQKRYGNSDVFNTIATFSSDGITIYDGGIRIYKSLLNPGEAKPNSFQYLYPYVTAINDTPPILDPNNRSYSNERFTIRKAHFWAFDPETATNMKNYSIRTNKTSLEFAYGTLAIQDKRKIEYVVQDFRNVPVIMTYIDDPAFVTLEKTNSYLGILQLDASQQDIIRLEANDYKIISSPNERRYELRVDVSMEYPDAEDAYLTVKYVQTAGTNVVETLRFRLPILAGTARLTRIFKELNVRGYNSTTRFSLEIGVENSTNPASSVNNRAIIHRIELEEVTSTVLSAEKAAFEMPLMASMGVDSVSNLFTIYTKQSANLPIVFNNVNAAGTGVMNTQRVGINVVNPQYDLHVAGTTWQNQAYAGSFFYSGDYVYAQNYAQVGNGVNYTFIRPRQTLIRGNLTSGGYAELWMETTGTGAPAVSGVINRIIMNSPENVANSIALVHTLIQDRFSSNIQRGLLVRNDHQGQATGLAATGDLYSWTNFRVPVIVSGTGAPGSVGMPPLKVGDIYIRYA